MIVKTSPYDLVKAYLLASYPETFRNMPPVLISRYIGVLVNRAVIQYFENQFDTTRLDHDFTIGYGKDKYVVMKRSEILALNTYRELVDLAKDHDIPKRKRRRS